MEEDGLMNFGLTRQEASIYICLCTNRELTGYEVAKLTGISRSNVYNGLSGLVAKGGAYVMEGAVSKYIPVSLEEFCANKIRALEREKEYLVRNMPNTPEPADGYITIEGYENICDKIVTMIKSAKRRIYISAQWDFILTLEKELMQAIREKTKLVILTNENVKMEDTTIYIKEKNEKEIRLIVDSKYVLTGEIKGTKFDTCLYSGQKNFVNVFKEAMSNEIKLLQIKSEACFTEFCQHDLRHAKSEEN